jgi:hypothetical protein
MGEFPLSINDLIIALQACPAPSLDPPAVVTVLNLSATVEWMDENKRFSSDYSVDHFVNYF